MSKRDLPAEKAAELGRIFYTPAEVSAMTTIEYQGVIAAIKGGEIPAEKIGNRYYIPAWWVNRHLNGPLDEIDAGTGSAEGDDLSRRRSA